MRRNVSILGVLATTGFVTAGCSGGSSSSTPECGPGTVQVDRTCVPEPAGGTGNAGSASDGGRLNTETGGGKTSGGSGADAGAGGSANAGASGRAAGGANAGTSGGGAGGADIREEIGARCSTPGTLGCSSASRKLTLVCSGEGVWERNETCAAGEVCDRGPGPDAGLCRAPDPECAALSEGAIFCRDNTVRKCNSDGLSRLSHLAQTCGAEAACVEGECAAADPCPEEEPVASCTDDCSDVYNCAPHPDRSPDCPMVPAVFDFDSVGVVRAPSTSDMCSCDGGPRFLRMRLGLVERARVRVSSPSYLIEISESQHPCAAPPTDPARCIAIEAFDSFSIFLVVPEGITLGPQNITIETGDDPQCP